MNALQRVREAVHDGNLLARTSLIAIDGPTAAGKTTLAAHLAPMLGAQVVAVDQLSAPGSRPWEWQRFRDEIWVPLAAGRSVRYQRHHWTQPEPGEFAALEPGRPVILEGLRSSIAELGDITDLVVWVDAPDDVRVERARARDPQRFACWSTKWRPIEEEWLAADDPRARADLVVSGLDPLFLVR